VLALRMCRTLLAKKVDRWRCVRVLALVRPDNSEGADPAWGVVNSLLERRLIRTVGRKDVVGRPLLYGTTREFLQAFGLKDLSELPALTELKDLLKQDQAGELWDMDENGNLVEKRPEDLVKQSEGEGTGTGEPGEGEAVPS